MINAVELYNAVHDKVKSEENGSLSILSYNIKSKSAEIKLLDYLTGDLEGMKPPEPYNNQKLRDALQLFVATDTKQITGNGSPVPDNYYRFQNLNVIGSYLDVNDCGEEVMVSKGDTVIELLGSQQFDKRCLTKIKDLRPSMKKPIAKISNNSFQYKPIDLGSVKLEYVRYPIFGQIKVKYDALYNEDVPDEINSINYEWPMYAFNLLVWFISGMYAIGTREKALVEQLQVEGKSVRG